MYNQKFSYFLSIISRSCEVKTRSFRVNVSTESALQVSQLTDEILVHYRAGILHTMQGGDNKWVMLCFDWITRVDEHRQDSCYGVRTVLLSPSNASQPSLAGDLTAVVLVLRVRSSMISRGNNLSFPSPLRFIRILEHENPKMIR